uniref:Uncharacterized protein n=1 Tax=Alexandrium catenella TaxID=2925 RepID=A0A7S1RHN3_ALECA
MDQDEQKDDTCLGWATLSLDYNFLRGATHKRQVCDMELYPAGSRQGQNLSPGTARVEISWEPSLVFNSASSARAMLWVMLRSPHILRVVGVSLLGTAFCCLFVAGTSRWLCRGPSLARCQIADVPGAGTCAYLSALTAFAAGSVHFLGSAGLFGVGWDDRPPTMVELAEADIEEESLGGQNSEDDQDERPSLRLSVHSSGAFPARMSWNVDILTNILPKMSSFPVRLFAWLVHLASTALAELALVLCWANTGRTTFLAEAAYLSLAAILCLIAAGVVFWHEGCVLRAQADKWKMREGADAGGRSTSRGNLLKDSTGGSAEINSPSLNLEEFAQRAQRQLQSNLAQPLIEAHHRLQGRLSLDNQNLREDLLRPLLDAGQRLQDHLDELNLPNLSQPLAEARQRIQEQLDSRQAMQEGGNSPRTRGRTLSLPPRWHSEELPRWMQPLFGITPLSEDEEEQQQQQQQPNSSSPQSRGRQDLGRSNTISPNSRGRLEAGPHGGRGVSFRRPSEEHPLLEDPAEAPATLSPPIDDEPTVRPSRGLCCVSNVRGV